MDAASEAPPSTTVDPTGDEDAANCELGASVTDKLKDAAIGDGASTSGICLGCATNKCKAVLATCTNDCDCQRVAGRLLDCYSKYGDDPVCNGFKNGPSGSPPERPNALAFFGCVEQSCATECAKRVATDGGSDAADASSGD